MTVRSPGVLTYLFERYGAVPQEVTFDLYRHLAKKWPQINDQTRIQLVDRTEVYLRNLDWSPFNIQPVVYIPLPGLRMWLLRLRARIHKWFVDHEHHPANRPEGWRPYNISQIGMKLIDPNPPVSTAAQRVLYLTVFGVSYRPRYFQPDRLYETKHIYVYCAYDAQTDTLYVRG